ncbi:hypothetical protein DSM104299_01116 [Baekduia alba]|nr:hypothetical protein DSM104299_01116 [Baekduia alba]
MGAAACGDDDASTATVVQEPTTAVEPSTVPTTTTETPPTSTDTNPTATTGEPTGGGEPTGAGTGTTTAPDTGGAPAGGEQAEGGAGDEEATRVPVALTTDGGALSPTTVTVPAFLSVEVAVTAKGAAEKVTIDAPGGGTLSVPAGGRATRTLSGLKPGDYAVTTAGGGRTVLHVVNGGDPGP